jgi:hypothetical protein
MSDFIDGFILEQAKIYRNNIIFANNNFGDGNYSAPIHSHHNWTANLRLA